MELRVDIDFKNQLSLGDARYFSESVNLPKLKKLLESSVVQERIIAVKWLLAMMTRGRDVSSFFPDIIRNIATPSVELKKLSYTFILHYTDHDQTCRELSMMSVNTFQKDLSDTFARNANDSIGSGNPLIRALAVKTLTSIAVKDVLQIQVFAVRTGMQDRSPYVRKITCLAICKVFDLVSAYGNQSEELDTVEELKGMVKQLLNDDSFLVLSSAIYCVTHLFSDIEEVCNLLHDHVLHLANTVLDLEEWSQPVFLSLLVLYCRKSFKDPGNCPTQNTKVAKGEDECKSEQSLAVPLPAITLEEFYADEELSKQSPLPSVSRETSAGSMAVEKATQQEGATDGADDLTLILSQLSKLQHSSNPSVLLGYCICLFYIGMQDEATSNRIVSCMLRLVRLTSASASHGIAVIALEFLLHLLDTCGDRHESVKVGLRKHISLFFLHSSVIDSRDVSLLKLKILGKVSSDETLEEVLSELQEYILFSDEVVVVASLKLLPILLQTAGDRRADQVQQAADSILTGLFSLVDSTDGIIREKAIEVIGCMCSALNNRFVLILKLCPFLLEGRLQSITSRVIVLNLVMNVVSLVQTREAYRMLSPVMLSVARYITASFISGSECFKLSSLLFIRTMVLKAASFDSELVAACVEGQDAALLLKLEKYIFQLAKFDPQILIRDYSRLIEMATWEDMLTILDTQICSSASRTPQSSLEPFKAESRAFLSFSSLVEPILPSLLFCPPWAIEASDPSIRRVSVRSAPNGTEISELASKGSFYSNSDEDEGTSSGTSQSSYDSSYSSEGSAATQSQSTDEAEQVSDIAAETETNLLVGMSNVPAHHTAEVQSDKNSGLDERLFRHTLLDKIKGEGLSVSYVFSRSSPYLQRSESETVAMLPLTLLVTNHTSRHLPSVSLHFPEGTTCELVDIKQDEQKVEALQISASFLLEKVVTGAAGENLMVSIQNDYGFFHCQFRCPLGELIRQPINPPTEASFKKSKTALGGLQEVIKLHRWFSSASNVEEELDIESLLFNNTGVNAWQSKARDQVLKKANVSEIIEISIKTTSTLAFYGEFYRLLNVPVVPILITVTKTEICVNCEEPLFATRLLQELSS